MVSIPPLFAAIFVLSGGIVLDASFNREFHRLISPVGRAEAPSLRCPRTVVQRSLGHE